MRLLSRSGNKKKTTSKNNTVRAGKDSFGRM